MDHEPGLSLVLHADAQRVFVLLTNHLGQVARGWSPATAEAPRNAPPSAAWGPDRLRRLLPDAVVAMLAGVPGGLLSVHLPPELDDVPIERLDDGLGPLGSRFGLTRHLLSGEAAEAAGENGRARTGPLRLAVIARDPAAPALRAATQRIAESGVQLRLQTDLAAAVAADVAIVVAVEGDLTAPGAASALESSAMSPSLWVWPAGGGDLEIVAVLQQHGHAALRPPAGLVGAALFEALAPFLQGCADGQMPAAALRTVSPRGGWRLYHSPPRPLCQRPAEAAPASEPPLDDHRQVSALSFDLVESTRLLEELGGEAYSELLQTLHARSLECITRQGGNVEERRGDDGSMACFGWPRALEDGAVRAVDAALAMQTMLRGLPGSPRLRIGIASGRVVIRSGVPYGPAVHLAARLRERAAPGQIVADIPSCKLVRQRFVFDTRTFEDLKGITGPVRVGCLVGRCAPEPMTEPPPTRLVGREVELSELQQRWRDACRGQRTALLVHGEAGMGKSRLVQEFLAGVAAAGGRFVVLRGLPETQGIAFRTLADALHQRLGLRHDDDPAARLAMIATAMPAGAAEPAALDELARLLTPAAPDAAGVPRSPGGSRERWLASMTDVVAAVAAESPLALVVEDLQWVDPSTRELLDRISQAASGAQLLVLATRRDEGDEEAAALAGAETLALQRLSPAASRWLIRESAGDGLPRELVERMAERAAGVPLFLEESARLAMELGGRTDAVLAEVPASLDGLLMARLDRLGLPDKRLVQAMAVIGREFPVSLLRSLLGDTELPWDLPGPDLLASRLAPLTRSRLLRVVEIAGLPCVGFGHELLRDVAYMSLWQRDRQRLHAAIVRALRAEAAEPYRHQPQLLAHHLAGAGEHAEAVPLWERAAHMAAAAAGNCEAISHLRAALHSLSQLPPSASNTRTELKLQLQLARRSIAAEGYGAAGVERAYTRAAALTEELDDADARTKVQLGLESMHVMRGELGHAEALAARALAGALSGRDLPTRLQARWALAHVRFHAGDSASALLLMDACLAEYRADATRPGVVQDPGVMCLCYSAWALWELGRADAARERAERVIELARTLGHRFSLAEACGFAASVALFRGDTAAGLDWSTQAIDLCEEDGYTVWLAHARIVHGRLLALTGDQGAGQSEMIAGYRQWTATGASITRPMYLSLIAETYIEGGALDAAAHAIDEARALVERTQERYHEAEVLRLAGRVACARGQHADGAALLRRAIALGARQGKKAFVLRAATTLTQAMAARGRHEEACALLQGALDEIVEGRETRDVRLARELLTSMGGGNVRKNAIGAALVRGDH